MLLNIQISIEKSYNTLNNWVPWVATVIIIAVIFIDWINCTICLSFSDIISSLCLANIFQRFSVVKVCVIRENIHCCERTRVERINWELWDQILAFFIDSTRERMTISTSEISKEISEVLSNQIWLEVMRSINLPFEEILLRMELRTVNRIVICFECSNIRIISGVVSNRCDLQVVI